MKRRLVIAVVLTVACVPAHAEDQGRDYARIVSELKERAARASEKDRAPALAELVRYEVELAGEQFDAGNSEGARGTISDLEQNVAQCREAAVSTGKNLKQTEIQLREAARRLDEIQRDANFEDQPALKHAVDLLQDARTAILDRMFGMKEKKK